MLQHEITPFANAHIAELKTVEALLTKIVETMTLPHIPDNDVIDALNKVKTAQRGFVRFRDCAEDEWKMKERLETRVRHCRLRHKDQE